MADAQDREPAQATPLSRIALHDTPTKVLDHVGHLLSLPEWSRDEIQQYIGRAVAAFSEAAPPSAPTLAARLDEVVTNLQNFAEVARRTAIATPRTHRNRDVLTALWGAIKGEAEHIAALRAAAPSSRGGTLRVNVYRDRELQATNLPVGEFAGTTPALGYGVLRAAPRAAAAAEPDDALGPVTITEADRVELAAAKPKCPRCGKLVIVHEGERFCPTEMCEIARMKGPAEPVQDDALIERILARIEVWHQEQDRHAFSTRHLIQSLAARLRTVPASERAEPQDTRRMDFIERHAQTIPVIVEGHLAMLRRGDFNTFRDEIDAKLARTSPPAERTEQESEP